MEQKRYRHTMILGNSYTRGYRVAIHSAVPENERSPDLKPQFRLLEGLTVSLHSLVTNSPEWDSVAETDPYFIGVLEVHDIQEFIDAVREDATLSEADVTTYLKVAFDIPESEMPAALEICNDACIREFGSPLYDPLKKDCPAAHVLNRSIASNRIVASDNGWERLRLIKSVMTSRNPA